MDRDVGKRTRKDQNIRIRRYNKVKPEACVAVDIRMEEYVMYEPTADRKGGEGAKGIDSRPVAAEGEPNRSRSGDGCLLFFSICLLLACSTKETRRRRKVGNVCVCGYHQC